jgi:hypothetical protein
MIRLAPLALVLALLPACDKPVTYSYFLIHAKLDSTVDDALLNRIAACAVEARTSLRTDSAQLACKQHFVTNDLGTFEYTTSLTSGAIKFVLIANDINGILMATGETPPLDIQVGKTVMADVVGTAAPGAKPDAGASVTAGTGTMPDGGTAD